MSNWKETELKVAKLFGGKRIPVNGGHDRDIDIPHPLWMDVKSRVEVSLPLIKRFKVARPPIQSGSIIYLSIRAMIDLEPLIAIPELIKIRQTTVQSWLDNIKISVPDEYIPCLMLHYPGQQIKHCVAVFDEAGFARYIAHRRTS